MVLPCLRPPTKPPSFTGPKPPIEGEGISQTEEIDINIPVHLFVEWCAKTPLEEMLNGVKGMEAVARTEMISGTWGEVGARRRVVLESGHQAAQEILESNWPWLLRYQLWGFTNQGRLLSKYAIGEIRSTESQCGVHIIWTYQFQKRSQLMSPVLSLFVRTTWANFMRSGLLTIKLGAENWFKTLSERSR